MSTTQSVEFTPAPTGLVFAAGDVNEAFEGGTYVDSAELLEALTAEWARNATAGKVIHYNDRVIVLAYTDSDGAAAHVIEHEDGLGWAIPHDGWWPLEWAIHKVPETWEVMAKAPAFAEPATAEFISPDDPDSYVAVQVSRTADGRLAADIDTEQLSKGEPIIVRLNGKVIH